MTPLLNAIQMAMMIDGCSMRCVGRVCTAGCGSTASSFGAPSVCGAGTLALPGCDMVVVERVATLRGPSLKHHVIPS